YNGLVADIGGPDQPGVGFGLGLERTIMLLEHQETEIPELYGLDVYLIALGEAAESEVTKLVYELRNKGPRAERDYQGRKMKAQMKSADRMNARFTAILGDDELANGEITLKEMATSQQRTV